jgi:hypothetical protein
MHLSAGKFGIVRTQGKSSKLHAGEKAPSGILEKVE